MAAMRLVPTSGSPIEIRSDVLVGRDPACDVVISDGSVSRRHARIEKRTTGWTVVDQGSANGTFLDSQRISEAVMRQGQRVRFGALEYQVDLMGEAADAQATIVQPVPAAPPPPPPPPARSVAVRPPRSAPPAQPISRPPRKSRGPVFWIAAGGCGCMTIALLLLVALIGIPLTLAFLGTREAQAAVQEQLAEIRRGDLASAYERLSTEGKSRLSPEEFESLVRDHPVLAENAGVSFHSRTRENNVVRFEGELTAASGTKEPVTITLVQEGGMWRISSISLE